MSGLGNYGTDEMLLAEALTSVLSQNDSDGHPFTIARPRASANSSRPAPVAAAPESDNAFASTPEDGIPCRSCGAICPRSNKYCGFCAAYLGNYASKKQFSEIELAPISLNVALISINEDSSDGVRIPLKYNETIIGRSGDSRFPSDAFLSPRHCRLLVEGRQLFIEDLDSLNGTFLRIRSEVQLHPGDCFFAGRELIRFERFEQVVSNKARSVDGTRYMGSPSSGGDFKLVQIGIGNITQNVYCISEAGASFGRENGDIVFNRDRFMSGRHAQIYPREDGNYYLADLNSSNGTWLKLSGKTRLSHGDLLFLGQQLFRVESPDIL
ncbi:MAG: FHA domain-containing protein [Proteobacteria bacterium]|nr:FHA domain-containing protein [Pseudomonadota bacterium]MBQ4359272.1 FHA domain-containing protein [Pseudomonadota bacterium]